MDKHQLPPGWETPRNNEYIAMRQIEDFTYAHVRYDANQDQYVLEAVNRDGPRQTNLLGRYVDLGKAFRAGDKL